MVAIAVTHLAAVKLYFLLVGNWETLAVGTHQDISVNSLIRCCRRERELNTAPIPPATDVVLHADSIVQRASAYVRF